MEKSLAFEHFVRRKINKLLILLLLLCCEEISFNLTFFLLSGRSGKNTKGKRNEMGRNFGND